MKVLFIVISLFATALAAESGSKYGKELATKPAEVKKPAAKEYDQKGASGHGSMQQMMSSKGMRRHMRKMHRGQGSMRRMMKNKGMRRHMRKMRRGQGFMRRMSKNKGMRRHMRKMHRSHGSMRRMMKIKGKRRHMRKMHHGQGSIRFMSGAGMRHMTGHHSSHKGGANKLNDSTVHGEKIGYGTPLLAS